MTRKSILITGCSSGIGAASAHLMRARGWRVFAACRKPEDCARLREAGFDAPLIDYRDESRIATGLAEVCDATGGTLDALFNNGAYALPGPVEDVPTDALRDIFQTNVFGWHALTRQVLPVMRAQGHGHIVQCSSVLGFVAFPWRGAYVASKYALEGLTDTLRLELRGSGIHVVLIEPGPIRTNIRENAIPHFERWIDWKASARAAEYEQGLLDKLYKGSAGTRFELGPEAVAEVLWRAVTSDSPQARYPVTVPTQMMALLRRILPTGALDSILAKG